MATVSLYRRYRPRRFAEIKGQDHVVRALRDSVASGREGQAYLFSGPRGTGKTTSARILAKVLNCERPVDGEPCCECPSCVEVERGVSYDVHELDAASNNKVEDIERIISSVNLGTPGRHKVYILDEVHMLSPAASAKLLKTLEEPPSHVVFVLATTNPEKVIDTIRSRTQHIRFHLLAPDTLAEHVRWIAEDAGLDIGEDAVAAAVSQGAGSARDTLSALELIASSGGDIGQQLQFDEFVEALIEHDPGRVLTAMATMINAGHEPRTVAEEFVKHLRNGFLALMAPELVQLPTPQVDALAAQSQRLGAAALVAAIERLGTIMIDLRHAPDPRVLVEVTLVQLTRQRAGDVGGGHDIEALTARVAKLEKSAAAAPAATSAAPAPIDPGTGRTKLGGRAQRSAEPAPAPPAPPAPAPPSPSPSPSPSPEPTSSASHEVEPQPAAAAATPAPAVIPAAPAPGTADLRAEWFDQVRPALRGLAKALYAAVEFVSAGDDAVVLAAPNATHRERSQAHIAEVEKAWRDTTGHPVRISWSDAPGSGTATPARPEPSPITETPADDADVDEVHEVDESRPAIVGNESVLDRLSQAFPGAERVAEPTERER